MKDCFFCIQSIDVFAYEGLFSYMKEMFFLCMKDYSFAHRKEFFCI
jgi:hypothetical protein